MLLDDFVTDLKQNGVADDEIRTQMDPSYGIVMFQMPYKGMNVSVWAYEDPAVGDYCIRVTTPKRPLLKDSEVLKELNKHNSEVEEFTYFIDEQFPKEVGLGKHPVLNGEKKVTLLYSEILFACDTMRETLADIIEIHED